MHTPVGTCLWRTLSFWEAGTPRPSCAPIRDYLPEGAGKNSASLSGSRACPSTYPFPPEHWGAKACAIVACYNGSKQDGQEAMAPLLEQLPEPMFDWMDSMPFPALQGMF